MFVLVSLRALCLRMGQGLSMLLPNWRPRPNLILGSVVVLGLASLDDNGIRVFPLWIIYDLIDDPVC